MSAKRRGKGRSEELLRRASADEALETLISQFSDPLVFLRELVQNSLDAAATHVDVSFAFDPTPSAKKGLLTITVADNGEGMSEQVIDDYLLTLFRSTKEHDLTKIGKFGVGFVSIFAMQPQLVVLETGQVGEAWRVIFHADARYEKLRLNEPVEGTTIALHKGASSPEHALLSDRGRETLRHWCKYAEAEIFVDGEPIGEAFGVDAALACEHGEPGTELVVGFARPEGEADAAEEATTEGDEDERQARDEGQTVAAAAGLAPVVGYYNRGLTLVESTRPPGSEDAAALAGISFRLKSRYLEHTLTRDNVLQDEHYAKAMALLRRQVDERLRPALIARLARLAAAEAAEDGPDLPLCLRYARLPAMDLVHRAPRARILPTAAGRGISWRELRRADEIYSATAPNRVSELLTARGVPVLRDGDGSVSRFVREQGLEILRADLLFYSAVPPAEDPARELALWLERVRALLDVAKARVRRLEIGVLDYPGSSVAQRLCVRQEQAFGLTRLGEDDRVTWLGGARELVVNVEHPLFVACRELSRGQPFLAAQLLAQGIAVVEEVAERRLAAAARRALRWSRAARKEAS